MQEGFCITIRTADRSPSKNYLLDTLSNLDRSGVFVSPIPHELVILDTGKGDGELHKQAQLWLNLRGINAKIIRSESPLTPNANAILALISGSQSQYAYTLFLEDDIDVCADFLESVDAWLRKNLTDSCRVYPLCAAYDQPNIRKRPDPFRYPVGSFYGTQGYVVRSEDAGKIGQWMTERLATNPMKQGHDLLIKEWARLNQESGCFLCPSPDFIQHEGKESSLHNGRFHEYKNFAGPTWSYINGQPSYFTLKEHAHPKTSKRLCSLLLTLPKQQPIYDLGCGVGAYVAFLQSHGYDARGIEGTPGIHSIARTPNIVVADLSKPIDGRFGEEKGIVLSLEVGEHIPAERESVFLDNLCLLCEETMILSWAVKGQNGVRHVNEQNAEDLLPKMEARGFRLLEEPTKLFREEAGKDYPWFKKSIYVLRKE